MAVAAAGRAHGAAAADRGAGAGRGAAGEGETGTAEPAGDRVVADRSPGQRAPERGGSAEPTEPTERGTRSTLSPLEEAILEFERAWWQRGPAKDERIRREFGISPTAYYLQLHSLINRADAEAYDPLLVQRIARRMEQGRRWREGT